MSLFCFFFSPHKLTSTITHTSCHQLSHQRGFHSPTAVLQILEVMIFKFGPLIFWFFTGWLDELKCVLNIEKKLRQLVFYLVFCWRITVKSKWIKLITGSNFFICATDFISFGPEEQTFWIILTLDFPKTDSLNFLLRVLIFIVCVLKTQRCFDITPPSFMIF